MVNPSPEVMVSKQGGQGVSNPNMQGNKQKEIEQPQMQENEEKWE